jgi:hypothetical protein
MAMYLHKQPGIWVLKLAVHTNDDYMYTGNYNLQSNSLTVNCKPASKIDWCFIPYMNTYPKETDKEKAHIISHAVSH